MTGFVVRVGVLGILAVLGAAACTAPAPAGKPAGAPSAAGIELRGLVPTEPAALPDATFTDTAGRAFRLRAAASAPVTVVFFGYTHCPEVCSTAVADLAQALRRVGPEIRKHVRVLFVTVDPARDQPSVLRAYLDRFDPAFVGLTGEDATLREVTGALGVALTGRRDAGEAYQLGHGAQLIGFDSAHQRRVIWPEGTPVGDLEHDLRSLVGEAK